jgi:hypothetical protein
LLNVLQGIEGWNSNDTIVLSKPIPLWPSEVPSNIVEELEPNTANGFRHTQETEAIDFQVPTNSASSSASLSSILPRVNHIPVAWIFPLQHLIPYPDRSASQACEQPSFDSGP